MKIREVLLSFVAQSLYDEHGCVLKSKTNKLVGTYKRTCVLDGNAMIIFVCIQSGTVISLVWSN